MQEVVRQISEQLVAFGHEVTVATQFMPSRTETVVNGVNIVQFKISGNAVRGYQFGEVEAYRKFLLNSGFDIITNFAAQQWATDLMLPMLGQIRAKKVFVPTGFSGLYLPEYKDYFREMKRWMQQYDMNVFLSDEYRDVLFARENGIAKILIIPNGADEREFGRNNGVDAAEVREKLGIPKDHFLILHVGSHTGMKGHGEAIRIFLEARIRKATLLIVANDLGGGCTQLCALKQKLFRYAPLQYMLRGRKELVKSMLKLRIVPDQWLSRKKLLIRELSRADTVACYKAANLFLFPSNIECSPLVLFEAMASRTPFLTSNVGNSSEIIDWSKGGALLPTRYGGQGYATVDIEASAQILEALYGDVPRREEMAASGFQAWQDRFTWASIARKYENLYQQLIREKP
jgi:glycosyltransferase involved in cell wall biosynthesis